MKIYKILSLVLWIMVLQACSTGDKHAEHQQKENQVKTMPVTDANVEATGPYFTHDQKGKPVLCWTEKVSDEEGYILKFAGYNLQENRFDKPITVEPSKGTRSHPESMNKVAFKEDGTIVALYAVKHVTKENPFAGSVFYTISVDQGNTWAPAAFLHSDTLPIYGRGFFDLTTLPDGEVGAVWLDGRFAEADTGSALFFAKTEKGKGFGIDKQIAESTCECCRTDLYVDTKDQIHVAYRDILFSLAAVGEQVRDIAHVVSQDHGKSFSQAQRISADNWAIEGCPHTGPSLASNQQGLHAVWFTAGGQPGLYYAFAEETEGSFGNRQLLSKNGRHPQMMALSESELAMVWEEYDKEEATQLANHPTSGHKHQKENASSFITFQVRGKDGAIKHEKRLTQGDQRLSHPVFIKVDTAHLLVAWVQEENDQPGIYYTLVEY